MDSESTHMVAQSKVSQCSNLQLKFHTIQGCKLLLEAIEKRLWTQKLMSQLDDLGEHLSSNRIELEAVREVCHQKGTHIQPNNPHLKIDLQQLSSSIMTGRDDLRWEAELERNPYKQEPGHSEEVCQWRTTTSNGLISCDGPWWFMTEWIRQGRPHICTPWLTHFSSLILRFTFCRRERLEFYKMKNLYSENSPQTRLTAVLFSRLAPYSGSTSAAPSYPRHKLVLPNPLPPIATSLSPLKQD
ncbi:hypothetical protein Tco_0272707 [Tanacetum coccineum]